MAVEAVIIPRSTQSPDEKVEHVSQMIYSLTSLSLTLSRVYQEFTTTTTDNGNKILESDYRKNLITTLTKSYEDMLSLFKGNHVFSDDNDDISDIFSSLSKSIIPEINEVDLRKVLLLFEKSLLSRGIFPKDRLLLEILIFVHVRTIYNSYVENCDYQMIQSWFKKLKVNSVVAKFVGELNKNTAIISEATITSKAIRYNTRNVIDLTNINAKLPLPSPDKKNILITSALPYVNNSPHLGNIIGCVLSADAYARYCKLKGYNCLYLCGTDEYGTATEFRAMRENISCSDLCDKYFKIHKKIYEWMDIDFDCFGRTSTPNHTLLTQQFYTDLKNMNLIIKKRTSQLFCTKHDRFLADRFVEGICPGCSYAEARGDQCDNCGLMLDSAVNLIEPRCVIDGTTPVVRESDHLFLDLTSVSSELKSWVDTVSVKGDWPQNTIGITNSWFAKGLKPRCITRDLTWGVPVNEEGYEKKVFYVWFDACIGYPSITADYLGEDWKKWWLNTDQVKLYQFMGKDNVNFHTVIFPSMQIGSDRNWTMLHHIDTTEFLLYEDGKFSKSRGIGVFGDDMVNLDIPSSIWRYHLLLNRPEKSDSKFSWDQFANSNNKDLLATIGNLINRVLKFACSKYNSVVPEYTINSEKEQNFISTVNAALKQYNKDFEAVRIRSAVRGALEIASIGNKYIQDSGLSVELYKSRRQECSNVIGVSINMIYMLAALLYPITPRVSMDIYKQLNLPPRIIEDEWTCSDVYPGHILGKPFHLFKIITAEQLEQLRVKFLSVKGAPSIDKTSIITSKPQEKRK